MTLVRQAALLVCTIATTVLCVSAFASPARGETSIARDVTFGTEGLVAIKWDESDFGRLAVDPARRIYFGTTQNRVRRFKSDGEIDYSWGVRGMSSHRDRGDLNFPSEVDLIPGGGLLMPSVTESSNSDISEESHEVIKLDSRGRFDTTFGKKGLLGARLVWFGTRSATATAMRPDGKFYMTGGNGSALFPSHARLNLLRPDGSIVERFGRKGAFRLTAMNRGFKRPENVLSEFTDVAILNGGDALISGAMGNRLIVTRVNSRGRLVRSFGGGDGILEVRCGPVSGVDSGSCRGPAAEMKIHAGPDGRWFYLLAQGYGQPNTIISFDRRGSLRQTFGKGGVARFGRPLGEDESFSGTSLGLLPDGRILVAGAPWSEDLQPGVMALLRRDGTLDKSFGSNGFLTASASGLEGIVDIEKDRRGGFIVVGDPLTYVEPPPFDPYEGPAEPTYAWLSRFVIR